jgi:hypothetical protein
MAFNTTNSELVIVELDSPFESIELQFVPDEISVPRKADLSRVQVVGRNNKLLHYTGGEETMPLKVEFYSDDENREDVIYKVDWLKSLCYNDGDVARARKVKVIFGDLFPYHVWAVESVTPILSHFDNTKGWLPMRASVDIQFVMDPDTNLLIRDVRRRKKLSRMEVLKRLENAGEFEGFGFGI